MMGQETRNKHTDYWKEHDIKENKEFVILSNIIHQEWADITAKQHKNLKGLTTQNLRDHMNEAELIFTALAELSTGQIAESTNAIGMVENKTGAKTGGSIAKKVGLFRKSREDFKSFKSIGSLNVYLRKKLFIDFFYSR